MRGEQRLNRIDKGVSDDQQIALRAICRDIFKITDIVYPVIIDLMVCVVILPVLTRKVFLHAAMVQFISRDVIDFVSGQI